MIFTCVHFCTHNIPPNFTRSACIWAIPVQNWPMGKANKKYSTLPRNINYFLHKILGVLPVNSQKCSQFEPSWILRKKKTFFQDLHGKTCKKSKKLSINPLKHMLRMQKVSFPLVFYLTCLLIPISLGYTGRDSTT